MPSLLTMIEDDIAVLKVRLAELETTHRVMLSLLERQPAKPVAKPAVKKPRGGPLNRGALKKARKMALSWLQAQTEPRPSKDIIAALSHSVPKLSDSTIWKGLKEMRDEGLIRWDDETRYYSIVRPAADQKVAS